MARMIAGAKEKKVKQQPVTIDVARHRGKELPVWYNTSRRIANAPQVLVTPLGRYDGSVGSTVTEVYTQPLLVAIKQTKCCRVCGEVKALTGFSVARGTILRATCKTCYYEKCRLWREKNHDHVLSHSRQSYRDNREQRREAGRKYRAENLERERERTRRYMEKNRNLGYLRMYQATHREWDALRAHNRRAKLRDGGVVRLREWRALKAAYDNCCLRCGRSESEVKISADHIIPVSRGGPNLITNLQPLCINCNCKKHTKVLDYRTTGFARMLHVRAARRAVDCG